MEQREKVIKYWAINDFHVDEGFHDPGDALEDYCLDAIGPEDLPEKVLLQGWVESERENVEVELAHEEWVDIKQWAEKEGLFNDVQEMQTRAE